MTTLIGDFVNRVDFKSYEDFYENFELKYNEDYNFGFDVVDKYAEIDPEKVALIWVNEEGEEHIFTFEDMKKYSNKVANLFKRLGINKGDKVMLTLKNRYEFWFCMVALHKIGAIVIPATHMLKLHDIDFRLKKANVKLVVSVEEDDLISDYNTAEKELRIDLKKLVIERDIDGWINFNKAIEEESDVFERPTGEDATKADEPFLIYFTSGTSGLPKMVAHKHTYSLGHIPTAKYWHNVKEDGIHHTSADTGWGKAVWGNLYGQWIAGTTVFIYDYERFNGIKLLEKIIEYKVNTFCAPPTIYRFLIKENIEGYDFSNLSYVTTAGEPLPPEVSKKFKEISGLTIKEGFGQTESTLMIGTFIWLDAKLGSIGKPSPLFNVELLDKDGEIVDIGDEGEISINVSEGVKPGLFKEYYKDPEKQAASWYDGHYHCGDTAWMDEEGYYHFIGRNDDIIKSSGYRIGPYEVESAVLSHDAVSNCAITGYPDPIRGQIVKATIILQPGYEESEELIKDIQNHVKKTTAPYKYPRLIEFVDEIPETISGKIRRVEIREKDNSN
ncbi:acetyl-coenzyme A synthetase [Methanobrevibacter woesei]|uniref:Acetyl-coenzyme A synthetase n=1 Tax=Methanobrevibacter woesei TaxID=190976 RepID=A0A2U1S9H3_9EURY|nr:AMP-binding protein [Methanobrevibacter woesei]PWB87142.1 acetyl-coenzyme A synthetase [Methanobrevibacter woesei]